MFDATLLLAMRLNSPTRINAPKVANRCRSYLPHQLDVMCLDMPKTKRNSHQTCARSHNSKFDKSKGISVPLRTPVLET